MGHYSGLLHLGKEALASESIPVYVMPRMYNFLKNNGPWSQLIDQKNILLKELHENESVQVLNKVKIIPLSVFVRVFFLNLSKDQILFLAREDFIFLLKSNGLYFIE